MLDTGATNYCRTLKFMHSGGVVHGHICPEKILVNAMSADIKLSDLGRCVVEGCSVAGSYNMSYACRRAGCAQQPSAKGDVWAAGCVYAELLEKKGPLFQGSTHKGAGQDLRARRPTVRNFAKGHDLRRHAHAPIRTRARPRARVTYWR